MGKKALSTGVEIKAKVESIVAKTKETGGINQIYCLACGGSKASFFPLEYLISAESKTLPIATFTANEFVYATPKRLRKNTLVFVMTLAGGTKETVNAAKIAKESGATVVALTGDHNAKILEYSDYSLFYDDELNGVYLQSSMSILTQVGFELLYQFENYEHYDKAQEGFAKLHSMCKHAAEKVGDRAKAFGEANKDEPVIYTIGSGPSQGVSYMQTICMFMEMEWIHSSSISAGDFFHGPFEVVDKSTPFLVFINEGRTRPMDERVLKFLSRYGASEKVTVIDAKELGLNMIDDSVIDFFNPMILWVAALKFNKALATAKNHPLLMRRYLNKVEY